MFKVVLTDTDGKIVFEGPLRNTADKATLAFAEVEPKGFETCAASVIEE